ncbi:PREDICTED: reverse mRNAase [Prunus dulcis]|uniref:PREDICTED: reverse mRNAase n=1 Tax=Prunus dulcis TaxID=3755 RepID=A0A5E4FXE0_PRUDU|nr:PREDICTED: reverse mRNAase [Prunus dulcis]
MERFKFQLGFHGSVAVRRRGLSGGLLLLWKEGWSVSVNSFSIAHIDVFATIPNGFSFRFTEFYVHLEPSQRHHSWELLRRLSYGNLRLWICIGDFNNEVVYEWEKSGGRDRSRLTMDAFKDPHFTWWNGREGNAMVEERLDRALVTDDVLEFFPQAKVVHLISDSSDHYPISLELGFNESRFSCTRKGRRRFHFEEFWVEESSCSDVIIDAWNSRNSEEFEAGPVSSSLKCQ